MLLTVIRYIKGYLRISIAGYSPERFLNLCSHKQIYLWGLTPKENCYEMYISIHGFRKIKPILKKTRTKVTILKRMGLPFFLHKYRRRKVFFGGALFCILFIYVMSLFIWNIHIEGNFSRTDQVLLEFLETKHIYHGIPKKKVDCERIVKDIRKEFDDIVWVSAYVKGTRLMIKVKENTDTFSEETKASSYAANDIVAEKDGVITDIVTRNGVPLVKPGDEVKKGDVLVSGKVEVKNDAGEVVNYQYQNADADITAKTILPYEEQLSFTHKVKEYTDSNRYAVYIKWRDCICSLGIRSHSYKESEQYTQEKQLKIGEHFYLPISFGIIQIKEYHSKENVYTKEEVQTLLSTKFERFCEKLTEQNIEILEKNVHIDLEKNSAKAKGNLVIQERIGTEAETERIDF